MAYKAGAVSWGARQGGSQPRAQPVDCRLRRREGDLLGINTDREAHTPDIPTGCMTGPCHCVCITHPKTLPPPPNRRRYIGNQSAEYTYCQAVAMATRPPTPPPPTTVTSKSHPHPITNPPPRPRPTIKLG